MKQIVSINYLTKILNMSRFHPLKFGFRLDSLKKNFTLVLLNIALKCYFWPILENSKSGSLRGYQGVRKPYFESFLPIYEIFCLFHIGIMLYLACNLFRVSYCMSTVFALVNFKIRVCQGVRKPCFEPFLPIF